MADGTVRDLLWRPTRRFAVVTVATVAAAFLGKLLLPTVAARLTFAAVLALAFATAASLLARRIACPACGHRFPPLKALRLRWGRAADRLDRCPQCALALDAPVASVPATAGRGT